MLPLRALLHKQVCNVCVVSPAGVCRLPPLVDSITQAQSTRQGSGPAGFCYC